MIPPGLAVVPDAGRPVVVTGCSERPVLGRGVVPPTRPVVPVPGRGVVPAPCAVMPVEGRGVIVDGAAPAPGTAAIGVSATAENPSTAAYAPAHVVGVPQVAAIG